MIWYTIFMKRSWDMHEWVSYDHWMGSLQRKGISVELRHWTLKNKKG